MKYVVGIIVSLVLALVAVQFELQKLAKLRLAPLPAMSLNVLVNSKTSARFVVPQDSVYEVALVIDRGTKNRALECDFGLSNLIGDCSNNRTIVDLDLTLFENGKALRDISVKGNNRTSWWGNSLGSQLIVFKGKKEKHYEIIVLMHSSLEKFKELNPRVQVTSETRQAKDTFVMASIFSIISLALMVGIFVSLLVVIVLFYKKKTQK